MAAAEGKAAAESLIPRFQFQRLLNLDQQARRITLVGEIDSQPALLTLERAAFPTDPATIIALLTNISCTTNLGANDIYRWYMAQSGSSASENAPPADLKINLIYPCTEQHIKKYTPQAVRMVTETPALYARHVRPYMEQKRAQGRLNWVFNIIEGRTEQEDVIMRDAGPEGSDEGFLLLPDLNWDRTTVEGLRLLALVERRDLWSLRDLQRKHVTWLKVMRERVLDATAKVYGDRGVERDLLKCYFHYQPSYYHLHIHVVHASLEAGATQATGKAFGLENLISQLEAMGTGDGDRDVGMADVDLTYILGEASDLWERLFGPLKRGETPTLGLSASK